MLIQLQITSLTLVFSLALMPTLAQSTTNTLSIAKTIPNQLVAKGRDLTDISIGGIKIGMTLKQVTNKLGKPDRTSQILDPCSGAKRITLRYPQLVVTVLGEGVLQIDNANPLYQTGEKIKIGDPLSKAKKTYDKLLSTPSSASEDGRELVYNRSSDGILRFKSKQGRIVSISIIVDDC